MKKTIAIVLALVLLVGGVVGGVIAWLQDTAEVENTFTIGKVDIDLTEELGGEDKVFTMVPGSATPKDPKVTVLANSEDCWLFVEVLETGDDENVLNWDVEEGEGKWTQLPGSTTVWYREVSKSETAQEFYVLTDNQVLVDEAATNNAANNTPKLNIKAYAIQQANIETPEEAWEELNP